jgi:tRNA (cmo5U34)-methyltransferase
MSDQFNTEIFNTELYLCPEKDELFETGPWPKPFVFNEDVARVFDDTICRSVPLYREVLACAAHWARDYFQPGTRIIDIGCSTGTFLELLGRLLKQPTALVGIDNSQPMLEKAREKLSKIQQIHAVELICDNAENCSFENSSVVTINYTFAIYLGGFESGRLVILKRKTQIAAPAISRDNYPTLRSF